jgi:hypothetical protein
VFGLYILTAGYLEGLSVTHESQLYNLGDAILHFRLVCVFRHPGSRRPCELTYLCLLITRKNSSLGMKFMWPAPTGNTMMRVFLDVLK